MPGTSFVRCACIYMMNSFFFIEIFCDLHRSDLFSQHIHPCVCVFFTLNRSFYHVDSPHAYIFIVLIVDRVHTYMVGDHRDEV